MNRQLTPAEISEDKRVRRQLQWLGDVDACALRVYMRVAGRVMVREVLEAAADVPLATGHITPVVRSRVQMLRTYAKGRGWRVTGRGLAATIRRRP